METLKNAQQLIKEGQSVKANKGNVKICVDVISFVCTDPKRYRILDYIYTVKDSVTGKISEIRNRDFANLTILN